MYFEYEHLNFCLPINNKQIKFTKIIQYGYIGVFLLFFEIYSDLILYQDNKISMNSL